LLVYDDQTTSLTLASFHWLRAPERIKFKLAVIVYRAVHDTAPRYLICYTALLTSHQDAVSGRELVIHLSRLVTVGDRSFGVAGPTHWNTLPKDITSAPSVGLLLFR